MNPEHQAEVDATAAALAQLERDGCTLTGEALLCLAIARAGYDINTTEVERCASCARVYHAADGDIYVDHDDHADLMRELRVRGLAKLYGMHFCDFACVQRAAYAIYQTY